MNLISRRGKNHGDSTIAATDTDDRAIARRMRSAAVEIQTEGRMKLHLSRAQQRALRETQAQAERMYARSLVGGAALERLVQDGRLMAVCAEQASIETIGELPEWDGETRIVHVLNVLCASGSLRLNRDRLLLGIASFDDVQPLEMAELWAVPQALRVCMSREWLDAARSVLEIAGERHLAECWIGGTRINFVRRQPAFFEHALRLLSESEDSDKRKYLEQRIDELGMSQQQLVQTAHAQESMLRMRMENIAANKRLIDALDWQKCFDMLSSVEQELNYDPAREYPQMEEESKAAVREQVCILARKLNLSELTVARHAVRAAQMAEEYHRSVCYWLYDDEGRRALATRMGASGAVLPRMVPDPSGRISAGIIIGLFALLLVIYVTALNSIWFALVGIPLTWCAAMAVMGRVFPMFVKPAKLLKLKITNVSDEMRTLVVLPVLLSDEERAKVICDHFETLGCLEQERNIQYLILGDFSDADSECMPEDDAIANAVRQRIQQMNARAGWEQYYYLHRQRRW